MSPAKVYCYMCCSVISFSFCRSILKKGYRYKNMFQKLKVHVLHLLYFLYFFSSDTEGGPIPVKKDPKTRH